MTPSPTAGHEGELAGKKIVKTINRLPVKATPPPLTIAQHKAAEDHDRDIKETRKSNNEQ